MNQENKKGFPSGFFLLLLMAVFVMITIQNLSEKRTSHVAFNYQVEYLVDLGLIDQNQSMKAPQSDNVVTFSGKFKESLDKNSKERYTYLQLLNQQNEFLSARTEELKELHRYEQEAIESATLFLNITGIRIPKSGYVVIGPKYDYSDLDIPQKYQRKNAITITQLPERNFKNLPEIEAMIEQKASSDEIKRQLDVIVNLLLSNRMSIYRKIDKQKLKEALETTSIPLMLSNIKEVVYGLDLLEDGSRLNAVRSVRNYKHYLNQWRATISQLTEAQEKIQISKQKLKDVNWFYYDQEFSTSNLELSALSQPENYSRWFAGAKKEYDAFDENKGSSFVVYSQNRNNVLDKTFKTEEPTPGYINYLFTLMPVIVVILLLYFVFSRQMKGVGSSAMNFGRSPARLLQPSADKITFQDVAGIDEVREELVEIVDFLKDSAKYIRLGAKIPKGVLLVGPPGTGKTLLAKAVAGEANCPFFSISGSDFVEMFVGVGASRVRDLFEQARKSSPCIIFIDEIDAVGRSRGHGLGGGNDEREQTLNQLLVELDGMNPASGIILIAATNRPDVLDKALLRPGRIDRQVQVSLPDVKGRLEILKVHAARYKVEAKTDLEGIAKMTVGFSGADLANVVNEAALQAAKQNRGAIYQANLEFAVDKIRFGKERSLALEPEDIKATAYHEAGHAIVALCVEHSDPVERVTVIPRTRSLGHTAFRQKKERVTYWYKEAIDKIAVLMGGQVAEELYVNDISSGAKQDIKVATNLARAMICEWGMNPILGKVCYDEGSQDSYGMTQEKVYSEETARIIDVEVKKLIDQGYERAKEILTTHKREVEEMTEALLKFETIDNHDVILIMEGKFSHPDKELKMETEEKLMLEGKGVVQPELKTFRPNLGGA